MIGTVWRWLDPSEARTVGSTPDYRDSMANERTFLAWIRTGLALLAGGLGIANFLPELGLPYLREALAIVLMLLGGVVSLRAVDRWSRCERAMRLGQPLPNSRFPAVLAMTVGLGALVLVLATVLTGHK